jgi:hypothetical protein
MANHGVHGTRECDICKRSIGRNGQAWVSHMRAHVRRGEATEKLTGDWKFGAHYEYRDKNGKLV